MEDLLALYAAPYDPRQPVVCFDERPCQLLADVSTPLPMKPGAPLRQDHEYSRKGTCCVLLAFEPLSGWRFVQVRAHRTAADYSHFMKALVAARYRAVDRIRLVQDNLNTHTPGSFYTAFSPHEAFTLAQKFELHYTPVKGSWLNMAEIEFAALAGQCLNRRLDTLALVKREVESWAAKRTKARKTVRWKFTQTEARRKLATKYRSIYQN
jgi:hypothetical protein